MSEILKVEGLKKYFDTPRGKLHAVDNVSFTINRGETLGVVGESGCGKSTLGCTILGLETADDGKIIFEGQETRNVNKKERKALRKKMQMIFQDPFSSLNPRLSVTELIADPLKAYGMYSAQERAQKVLELMDTVGLARRFAHCYPHELDGGRRQRIGIARALSLNPSFIVCDEPVSALDVSIQAQILNLLQDLQEQHGLTYIFITHDLSVAKHISNDILVMYLGCMVEKCEAKSLFRKPLHPYTKGLLSAIPVPNIDIQRKRVIMKGELTSPIEPKPGCRFAPRCSCAARLCVSEDPVFEEVEPGHFVACHNVRDLS
ncbi:MAG: ABC transporter ATP-binding protein [Oscillospiraceae bacterium]